ncbi:hypothetical protein Glove_360g49 [Diversispora epigaea]|uniref:Uncharacterized protein n=1 Tax=Diversispora epigaea TaxID=1348612 RepID=A0A397HD59_9GLOM|nr:hypothetical protein Glove_360g49 [Diversispora epigaea]
MSLQTCDSLKIKKRGRKSYNVREGYIDPSGQTHIMTVRRTNNPLQKKKPKNNKITVKNHYCKHNDEFLKVINERISNFENLAQEIKHTINMNNINMNNLNRDQIDPKIISPDFPAMKTVELIEFSHNLERLLFKKQETLTSIP